MPQVSFSADIKPLFSAIDISHMKRFGVELDSYTTCRVRTTQTKCSRLSPRTMASPPQCLPVGPIGQRTSSHYSRNGRAADTGRDLFSRPKAAPIRLGRKGVKAWRVFEAA